MNTTNVISLTGKQLLDALSLITGDALRRDLTADELETEIDIAHREPWHDKESGEDQPSGLYANLTEDRQEGLYGPLGDTHEAKRIVVRRILDFQDYEIKLILEGLDLLRQEEYRKCKWEPQENGQYYYTDNYRVKQIRFIERSIARQVSAPNVPHEPRG
jgi:hypothetical protein